ncbi:MAG TPA: SH3 domain-containing protein [Candidatus Limnocylindria bacterium]|nr:SH3 domain-containing protein [Candidatus Limnocylindria bacterium]
MTRQSYPPLRPQPPVRPHRPRRPSWTLLIGVVVLVLLLAVVAFLLLNGQDNSDPGASPSGSPLASAPVASVSATPSADASSSAAASPSAGAGTFAPDSLVTLLAEGLTLRAEPGTDSEVLARLPAGQTAFVIAGPESANGMPWYHLSGMGLPHATGCGPHEAGTLLECPAWLGWVAAADADGAPWIQAAEAPACPTDPPTLVSLTDLPYTMRLVCHDAADMTFRAFWPALPEGTTPPEGACPAAEAAIGWLVCQSINQNLIAADEAEGASGGGRLTVNIPPGSSLVMPERGQWVDVTGHFDDPAAQQCADVSGLMATDPGDLVFTCRLQFVLTAVAPAPAP